MNHTKLNMARHANFGKKTKKIWASSQETWSEIPENRLRLKLVSLTEAGHRLEISYTETRDIILSR